MTITPAVNPDFRRKAFERFVYDFVLPDSPTRPKDEPSDALWTFLPVLYQSAAEDSLIATAVDAVSYINYSNRCHDAHAAALGEECVAKAIPMLTKVIADKKRSATNEALSSVYLMGVYEVCRDYPVAKTKLTWCRTSPTCSEKARLLLIITVRLPCFSCEPWSSTTAIQYPPGSTK